jgi:Holliday junction resolvase RusA-like endonuclease
LDQYIQIKPLSVNKCWQGRRFKTRDYLTYEKEVLLKLKKDKMPESKPYKLYLVAGLSNSNADLDNICKPILDLLQKKYNFNDRDVSEIHMKKNKVEKGKEYVYIQIE